MNYRHQQLMFTPELKRWSTESLQPCRFCWISCSVWLWWENLQCWRGHTTFSCFLWPSQIYLQVGSFLIGIEIMLGNNFNSIEKRWFTKYYELCVWVLEIANVKPYYFALLKMNRFLPKCFSTLGIARVKSVLKRVFLLNDVLKCLTEVTFRAK